MSDTLDASRPLLSILIVNWRSGSAVQRCISSIDRHVGSASSLKYELIVADNTPGDRELEKLYDHPGVRIVQNPTNLGFARGCNVCAKLARGELFLFLNPDTEFVDATLHVACAWLIENPFAGVVGCRQITPGGKFQPNSIQRFPTLANQIVDSRLVDGMLKRLDGFSHGKDIPRPVEAVGGAFILISRLAFYTVRGFTENYFMYSEDIDLCYKLLKAGYRSYYMGDVRVVHYGGVSTNAKGGNRFSTIVIRESTFRFLREHHGIASAWMYRTTLTLVSFVRLSVLGLAFLLVTLSRGRDRNNARDALVKWKNVSRWALGLEKWVSRL